MKQETLIVRLESREFIRVRFNEGFNKDNDVIPIEARKGALLSIKAMTNFINQLRKEEQIN